VSDNDYLILVPELTPEGEAAAIDEFIGGKPVDYIGYDGKSYIAQFLDGHKNQLGAPSLTITNAAGEVVHDIFFAEHKARTFYRNLDR
jgi:hypothetical protein